MPIFSGVKTTGLNPNFSFSNDVVLAGCIIVLRDPIPGIARTNLHMRLALSV
jgi:hypothetical protein